MFGQFLKNKSVVLLLLLFYPKSNTMKKKCAKKIIEKDARDHKGQLWVW